MNIIIRSRKKPDVITRKHAKTIFGYDHIRDWHKHRLDNELCQGKKTLKKE